PLEQLRGEVRVLTGRLRDVPTVDDLPDAPEGDEPSQLRDAVATLDDRCRDAHQRLVDRAATAQQRADGHHQAVVVLVQKVLPDIDLTSMAEGAARAHAAHEQINRRLQDVRTTAEVSRQTAQRLAKV